VVKTLNFPFFSSKLPVLGLQTSNLDGETNLKIRKALEKTWDYVTPEKAAEFKGLFLPLNFFQRLFQESNMKFFQAEKKGKKKILVPHAAVVGCWMAFRCCCFERFRRIVPFPSACFFKTSN